MEIKGIEDGAFCGIKKLSTLNLAHNKLTSLPELCSLNCCLEHLEVTNNNISRLSKYFFKGFEKLKRINLNRNNLFELPELHWIQHSVSTIMATRNEIRSLDALNTHGIYKFLYVANFEHNAIRTINVSFLRHMPTLRYLNLNENTLNYVDDFRSLYVRIIDLRNNPWHCDAELSWMGEEEMGFEKRLTCATPTCLHGMAIADMSKKKTYLKFVTLLTSSSGFSWLGTTWFKGFIKVISLWRGQWWSECITLLQKNPGVFCNVGYRSETHVKLKSCEISFVHNIRSVCPTDVKFCRAR